MKLSRETTFGVTVHVQMPTEKLDVYRNESFVARFRLLSNDEVEAMSGEDKSIKEQLDRVLVSVEGVGDANDNAYEPTEAAELIKQNTITSLATLYAYNKAVGKDIEGKTRKPSSGK